MRENPDSDSDILIYFGRFWEAVLLIGRFDKMIVLESFISLRIGCIRPRDEAVGNIAENRGLRKYTLSEKRAEWLTSVRYYGV
jgi:hypothetical protein